MCGIVRSSNLAESGNCRMADKPTEIPEPTDEELIAFMSPKTKQAWARSNLTPQERAQIWQGNKKLYLAAQRSNQKKKRQSIRLQQPIFGGAWTRLLAVRSCLRSSSNLAVRARSSRKRRTLRRLRAQTNQNRLGNLLHRQNRTGGTGKRFSGGSKQAQLYFWTGTESGGEYQCGPCLGFLRLRRLASAWRG